MSPTDDALRAAVAAFEAAFPGCVRGYYLEGSLADGTGLATSDVDLVVVFKGNLDGAGRARAQGVGASCAAVCATDHHVELDVVVADEEELSRGAYPTLKLGSRLVHGEDIRDRLALLPPDEWARQRMHAAYTLMARVFARPLPVRLPLDYPDPHGSLYGYDNRTVRLADGRAVPSTRNLVRVTGWAATALVALRAGGYVARKGDCHAAYRWYIGDEWSDLLEKIYRRCRTEWSYLVPEAEGDRAALRDICRRTLQFENHYLLVYRGYLLSELRGENDAARQAVLATLQHTPFDDDEVRRTTGDTLPRPSPSDR